MTIINAHTHTIFGIVQEKGGHLFQRRGMVIRDLGRVPTCRERRMMPDRRKGGHGHGSSRWRDPA